MQSLFGLELTTAQKVIVASVVILVLLALLGLFVRQIQGGRLRVPGQAGGRQRQPRLGIVDTYDLDRQRQLVLIRRDNVEHLLMVGGASDVVVESNIVRGASRSTTPIFNETVPQDRPLPPFETLVPPSEPALRAGEEIRRSAPVPELGEPLPVVPMRPVQIPVETAAATSAGFAAALDVETAASSHQPAPAAPPIPMSAQAPSFAREHAPAPVVSPGELDDMTRQLEAALKRPFSAVRPANPTEQAAAPARGVPPAAPQVEPPQRAPSIERVEPQPVAPKAVEPSKPAAPKPVEAAPAPIQVAPIPVKPQAMLDMEAELEAALGLKPKAADTRPVVAQAAEPKVADSKLVQPKPVEPKTAEPKPAEPKPADSRSAEPKSVEIKPVEIKPVPSAQPAMAASQPAVTEPAPISAKPMDKAPPAPAKPESVKVPAPAASPEPAATESSPKPVEAEIPKDEPPKPAETAKEVDPFSVDAIEAEFARLLGRDPKKS